MKGLTIGVLALQGDFEKHAAVLESLGNQVIRVKRPGELDLCDALIIPGGESTAITRQLQFSGLNGPIEKFAQHKPLWGTCAGIILMSKQTCSSNVCTFGLLDIEINRNAYGRQTDSFSTPIEVELDEISQPFEAIFIRAPKIQSWNKETVKILARYEEQPILVRQGMHLGSTFHPELTEDTLIHRYFLSIVQEVKS